jgi:hypothetical protein
MHHRASLHRPLLDYRGTHYHPLRHILVHLLKTLGDYHNRNHNRKHK